MQDNIRLQPLVDFKQNKVIGYEVLCKKDPEKGFPEAHEILQRVFKGRNYSKDFSFFVNLSPNEIANDNFCEDFLVTLNKLHIDERKIVLEVSESTPPELLRIVSKRLDYLKRLGLKIALDDFGTQYSSLSFMSELPIDIVKIDQKFVQKAPIDKKSQAMLKFVVQVSHEIGCSVIAEGIETMAQLRCAEEAGTDIGQGFIFAQMTPQMNSKNFASQKCGLVPFVNLSQIRTCMSESFFISPQFC